MKLLLVIILLGGLGYLVYAQHDKIDTLQTALDQSTAQVSTLQAKLAEAQAKQAAAAANPAAQPTPNPLDVRPSSNPQSAPGGSSLLDRNHRSPFDR